MRKTLMTMLCLAAMTMASAQTTKRIMTVVQKDGTTKEYKVDNVERVKFSEKTYADLSNQWDLNGDVNTVGTVILAEDGDKYTFRLFTSESVGASLDSYDLLVQMPVALMGQDVNLADAEGVTVADASQKVYKTGTVKVKFDKFQKNVTVSLEAENDGDELRCEYTGAFGRTYAATNSFEVVSGDNGETYNVASAFCVQPASVGEATNFAFSNVEAQTPADFLGANVAVWVSVSASKLYNGTVDMVADAGSYTFRYIDYATRTVYEKVQEGTITTAQGYNGQTYVCVEAVLEDGTQVRLSYFGKVNDTESLDAIIPSIVDENQYKYFNSDGDVSIERNLGTSYVEDYKGNLTFYLIPDGDTKYSSEKVQIKVEQGFVNVGEIKLAEVDDTKVFDIKFSNGGIQLQSYAAGYGYGNIPNNGTLTVSKDDDGVYDIKLDVTNSYHNKYTETGGDNTRLVLHYHGTPEAY